MGVGSLVLFKAFLYHNRVLDRTWNKYWKNVIICSSSLDLLFFWALEEKKSLWLNWLSSEDSLKLRWSRCGRWRHRVLPPGVDHLQRKIGCAHTHTHTIRNELCMVAHTGAEPAVESESSRKDLRYLSHSHVTMSAWLLSKYE